MRPHCTAPRRKYLPPQNTALHRTARGLLTSAIGGAQASVVPPVKTQIICCRFFCKRKSAPNTNKTFSRSHTHRLCLRRMLHGLLPPSLSPPQPPPPPPSPLPPLRAVRDLYIHNCGAKTYDAPAILENVNFVPWYHLLPFFKAGERAIRKNPSSDRAHTQMVLLRRMLPPSSRPPRGGGDTGK